MDRRYLLRKGAPGLAATVGLISLVSDSAEAEQENQELQGEQEIGSFWPTVGYGSIIIGLPLFIYQLRKNKRDFIEHLRNSD